MKKVEVGRAVIGSWGRIGLVSDMYGKEEFNRIHTYATVRYAEGDSEEILVSDLKVY